MRKVILTSLFLVFLFAGCTANNNQNLQKQDKKYSKIEDCKIYPEDFRRFDCYKEKGNEGDIVAQSWVAYYYNVGKIVPKDQKKATMLYLNAAKAGDVYSQRELGINYLQFKNYEEAFYWLEKAANSNDAIAQREVANLYDRGQSVKKDLSKAFEYYKKAAFQGDTLAENQLGYYYQYGYGVEKDFNKAKYWYEKTMKKGDAYGISQIAYLYANGYGVERDYKKAYDLFSKAAQKDDKYSMSWLGYLYEKGFGVKKDLEKAKVWYIKAGDDYSKKRFYIIENKIKE